MYKFSQQKPVISIDDTTGPLDEVYFPSVTVCNMNQVIFQLLIFSYASSSTLHPRQRVGQSVVVSDSEA